MEIIKWLNQTASRRRLVPILSLSLLFILPLTLTGCQAKPEVKAPVERAVKVIEAKAVEKEAYLPYVGTVDAKEIVRYSFKTPGRIATLAVNKGDVVKKGQVLAKLDPTELLLQTNAASASLKAAEGAINQAQAAYDYDAANLPKMKELLDSGALSQDQYDQLVLKTTVSKEKLDQAIAQKNALRSDADYKAYLLENSVIKAESDGVVAETLYKENEQVGAYYPVVVLRSTESVVRVGVASKDIEKLQVGTTAVVEIDGKTLKGTLSLLEAIPDTATRTYKAEVTVNSAIDTSKSNSAASSSTSASASASSPSSSLPLGAIAKVKFASGKASGIWVPVDSVLSLGESYVYVVKENRAYKKIVTVETIEGPNLRVTGLEGGEKVVVSGMKTLSDGVKVKVVQ